MTKLRLILILNSFLVSSDSLVVSELFYFFPAGDGIRSLTVTGVQTCALPISLRRHEVAVVVRADPRPAQAGHARRVGRARDGRQHVLEIGRASCRDRVSDLSV